MLNSVKNIFARAVPLTIAIIIPFTFLTVLIVGLVGYLSFINSKNAVNDVAHTLRNEIATRIENHLETFLNAPRKINTLNSNALKNGLLNVNDPAGIEHYFRGQLLVYDSVSSIYFGNTYGGLVNCGREGITDFQYVILTDDFRKGTLKKYAIDADGNRTSLIVAIPGFDARTRDWYKGAVREGTNTWSKPYILFTGQDMAIAASRPVYNKDHQLLGVVSVDIFLSQISNFLQNLAIGHHGQAFIIDRSGRLIAASSGEKPLTVPAVGQKPRRLNGTESLNPTIKYANESLRKRFTDYNLITSTENFDFEIKGERQLVQITPLTNANGLTWLIGVVIPEADFMAQITKNNRTTIFLSLCAIIFSTLFIFFIAQRIALPILQLSNGALNIARGEWGNAIQDKNQFVEISTLTNSFNTMSSQLQDMLSKLNHEITGRKQVETELRDSKEKLIAILQAIPDPLVVYDSSGFPLYLNPSFTEVFGWTLEELEKTRIPFVPEAEKNITESKIKEIFKTGQPVQMETARLTRQGETTPVHLSAAIVKNFSEKHTGLVVILTDISERKQMEEELRHAHKMESIGTLTGGIAHDFNNILSIILGNCELALESVSHNDPARRHFEEINHASQRASGIVKQLLSFSRKTNQHHIPIKIGPVVCETLKLLRATIPTTIELRKKICENEKTVLADPVQINQIIMNLCINSSHEIDHESGVIEISVDTVTYADKGNESNHSLPGNYVRLTVSDNGQGIDPEIIDRVFDPYFTTKEIGKGSGMGLAVVHGIVKNHGGTISVRNRSDNGVIFTILFPVTNQPHEITAINNKTPRTGNEKILVVDDEELIVSMTTQMLRRLGYSVHGTTNPQQALQLLQIESNHFDLVISDMTMPEMTGISFAEKLQTINPDIPVIICTGHDQHRNTTNAVAAFLSKPIPMHDLAETLRSVLDS